MKLLIAVTLLGAFAATTSADDKKPEPPVALKLVAKTDKYKFDGGGKTPAEFKKHLDAVANAQKDGKLVQPPKPPAVDLVLQIVNTSKNDVTIYVGGDANVWTFELTGGDGTAALGSGLAMTLEFRLPKEVKLAPGKSHEIPVKVLADGARGSGRYVYWTGPGEYKLSAKYAVGLTAEGQPVELKSEPVKITVEK